MAGPRNRWPTKLLLLGVAALLIAGAAPWPFRAPAVLAAELKPRSMRMSDSRAGQNNVTYRLDVKVATTGLIGSISVEFCGNSPLVGELCTPPTGFDATNVTMAGQAGVTGFTIANTSTANQIILSRPPASETAGTTATYHFGNLVNPTSGLLFARIQTYATSDASGPSTDDGGLAMAINEAITITTEVPPFLTLCVGETITGFNCSTATEAFSDLGDLNSFVTSAAQHEIVAATNAANGYTMWVTGTTMTSGNNVIPALNGAPSVKGVPQFGLNFRANTVPIIGHDPVGPGIAAVDPAYDQPNLFRFQSGDAVVTSPGPDDLRKFTVSYIVNVAANQPGGVYATTLTYTGLANF